MVGILSSEGVMPLPVTIYKNSRSMSLMNLIRLDKYDDFISQLEYCSNLIKNNRDSPIRLKEDMMEVFSHDFNMADSQGYTALHHAAYNGREKFLRSLISSGYDDESINNSSNLIRLSASCVDVFAKEQKLQRTALIIAAGSGNATGCQIIMDELYRRFNLKECVIKKKDTSGLFKILDFLCAKDNMDRSAFDVALREGHDSVVRVLMTSIQFLNGLLIVACSHAIEYMLNCSLGTGDAAIDIEPYVEDTVNGQNINENKVLSNGISSAPVKYVKMFIDAGVHAILSENCLKNRFPLNIGKGSSGRGVESTNNIPNALTTASEGALCIKNAVSQLFCPLPQEEPWAGFFDVPFQLRFPPVKGDETRQIITSMFSSSKIQELDNHAYLWSLLPSKLLSTVRLRVACRVSSVPLSTTPSSVSILGNDVSPSMLSSSTGIGGLTSSWTASMSEEKAEALLEKEVQALPAPLDNRKIKVKFGNTNSTHVHDLKKEGIFGEDETMSDTSFYSEAEDSPRKVPKALANTLKFLMKKQTIENKDKNTKKNAPIKFSTVTNPFLDVTANQMIQNPFHSQKEFINSDDDDIPFSNEDGDSSYSAVLLDVPPLIPLLPGPSYKHSSPKLLAPPQSEVLNKESSQPVNNQQHTARSVVSFGISSPSKSIQLDPLAESPLLQLPAKSLMRHNLLATHFIPPQAQDFILKENNFNLNPHILMCLASAGLPLPPLVVDNAKKTTNIDSNSMNTSRNQNVNVNQSDKKNINCADNRPVRSFSRASNNSSTSSRSDLFANQTTNQNNIFKTLDQENWLLGSNESLEFASAPQNVQDWNGQTFANPFEDKNSENNVDMTYDLNEEIVDSFENHTHSKNPSLVMDNVIEVGSGRNSILFSSSKMGMDDETSVIHHTPPITFSPLHTNKDRKTHYQPSVIPSLTSTVSDKNNSEFIAQEVEDQNQTVPDVSYHVNQILPAEMKPQPDNEVEIDNQFASSNVSIFDIKESNTNNHFHQGDITFNDLSTSAPENDHLIVQLPRIIEQQDESHKEEIYDKNVSPWAERQALSLMQRAQISFSMQNDSDDEKEINNSDAEILNQNKSTINESGEAKNDDDGDAKVENIVFKHVSTFNVLNSSISSEESQKSNAEVFDDHSNKLFNSFKHSSFSSNPFFPYNEDKMDDNNGSKILKNNQAPISSFKDEYEPSPMNTVATNQISMNHENDNFTPPSSLFNKSAKRLYQSPYNDQDQNIIIFPEQKNNISATLYDEDDPFSAPNIADKWLNINPTNKPEALQQVMKEDHHDKNHSLKSFSDSNPRIDIISRNSAHSHQSLISPEISVKTANNHHHKIKSTSFSNISEENELSTNRTEEQQQHSAENSTFTSASFTKEMSQPKHHSRNNSDVNHKKSDSNGLYGLGSSSVRRLLANRILADGGIDHHPIRSHLSPNSHSNSTHSAMVPKSNQYEENTSSFSAIPIPRRSSFSSQKAPESSFNDDITKENMPRLESEDSISLLTSQSTLNTENITSNEQQIEIIDRFSFEPSNLPQTSNYAPAESNLDNLSPAPFIMPFMMNGVAKPINNFNKNSGSSVKVPRQQDSLQQSNSAPLPSLEVLFKGVHLMPSPVQVPASNNRHENLMNTAPALGSSPSVRLEDLMHTSDSEDLLDF